MYLVQQAGRQILPDSCNTAADPDVLSASSVLCLLQGGLDAVCHEMKGRSALHDERRARVVGEHEDRHMIRRVTSPPPFPAFIRPLSADRSEHVSAHDP